MHSNITVPKPSLKNVDETSLSLSLDHFSVPNNSEVKIQYKIPQIPWEDAKELQVNKDSLTITEPSDLVDLEPGTIYMVRYVVRLDDGNIVYGPEAVFDTKPITCGPKKRKCVIM